jgi:hypothetical protein
MSKFTAYVLISSDTDDIDETVFELMLPYFDSGFGEPEYETICVCRRVKADRVQQEMSLGRAGMKKELEELYQAVSLEDDEETYWKEVTKLEDTLCEKKRRDQELLREKLLNEAIANPDCPWCRGTGTYRTHANLFGRWDWHQIGKTKGKNFNNALKRSSRGNGNTCVALVKDLDLAALEVPEAIVTPDGIWRESWALSAFERHIFPDRHLDWLRILESYQDHLVVHVECHYKAFLRQILS